LRAGIVSLSIAVTVTIAALLIGTPAAYALARDEFPGKRAVETLILAPLLVPPFAVALGLTLELLTLEKLGPRLYHTMTGVILAHLIPTLPYVIRLTQANFATQVRDLDRVAATLGASPARIFWHVALPAARPTLILAGLFAFMISLSTYLLTFLIGGGLVITLPTLLFSQISNLNRAAAAVTAIVLITPGIVYLLLAERLLRRSRSTLDFPVT
jgi:putative spermidine/putrescine transport system permease protein